MVFEKRYLSHETEREERIRELSHVPEEERNCTDPGSVARQAFTVCQSAETRARVSRSEDIASALIVLLHVMVVKSGCKICSTHSQAHSQATSLFPREQVADRLSPPFLSFFLSLSRDACFAHPFVPREGSRKVVRTGFGKVLAENPVRLGLEARTWGGLDNPERTSVRGVQPRSSPAYTHAREHARVTHKKIELFRFQRLPFTTLLLRSSM